MAIAITLSPMGLKDNISIVFAEGNDHGDEYDRIHESQIIVQVQRSIQNSQVVAGGDTIGSGNNFNFQSQNNSGSNALGQQ